MGFLNNAVDEFGKKTGKALGNKLFGKNADDIRIGVGESERRGGEKTSKLDLEIAKLENSTRQSEIDQKAIELEIETKREDKNQLRKTANEIAAIVFSKTDIEDNIAKLDFILPYAKMDPKRGEAYEELVDIAQTKFKTGLALCRQINPDHPMLEIYEEQKLSRKKDNRRSDEDEETAVLSASEIRDINKAEFSSSDIDANIRILNNLLVYFDMSPDDYDEKESVAIKAAQSKFKSGLAMCKAIAPNNPMIVFLENERKEKIANLTQKKEKEKQEAKKTSRLFFILGIGMPVLMLLLWWILDYFDLLD